MVSESILSAPALTLAQIARRFRPRFAVWKSKPGPAGTQIACTDDFSETGTIELAVGTGLRAAAVKVGGQQLTRVAECRWHSHRDGCDYIVEPVKLEGANLLRALDYTVAKLARYRQCLELEKQKVNDAFLQVRSAWNSLRLVRGMRVGEVDPKHPGDIPLTEEMLELWREDAERFVQNAAQYLRERLVAQAQYREAITIGELELARRAAGGKGQS